MESNNKNMEHFRFIISYLIVLVTCSCAALPVRGPANKEEFERLRFISYSEFARAATTSPVSDDLPEKPVLSDYLAYAALHNPGLEAAFNRWKAALEKIPQATSLPDPRFSYAYFIQEVETRVGPQRQKLALSQTFPWFGKLSLRGDIAFQASEMERQKYEAAKLKLFYRVKSAYAEYYYLAKAISITRENLSLMKYLESVARNNYSAGLASYSDVVKAQVEISKLEDRIETLRELRGPIMAKLNAAMNRPERAPLPWPESLPFRNISISEKQLFSWLKNKNPALKAKEFEISREQAAVNLAKKSYFPDITLGVEWIDTDEALKSGTKDSGKDPVIAMVSVNIPIWHGKYRAEKREAEARYRAAQKEHQNIENNLVSEAKMVLYRIEDSQRKIGLYRDTLIPQTKEALDVSLQSFKAGEATFLDIIDAQRTLLEFQLSMERALADLATRIAQLEMIVGKEIPGRED